MRDYIVLSEWSGAWLPRVVRCDDPKEAIEATVADYMSPPDEESKPYLAWRELTAIRKLPRRHVWTVAYVTHYPARPDLGYEAAEVQGQLRLSTYPKVGEGWDRMDWVRLDRNGKSIRRHDAAALR